MSPAVIAPVAIKEILFATDFSPSSRVVLPLISSIARRFASHLTVLNVWSEPMAAGMAAETAGPARLLCDEAAHLCMSDLLSQADLAGVKSSPLLLEGEPAREILAAIEALQPDLLVIPTHGRTGLAHAVLGSVAESVFRRARCPVLTVGPALAPRFAGGMEFGNFLVATDLSSDSRAAAPLAAELLRPMHGKVHVLHVLPRETASNPDALTLAEPLRRQMKRMFAGLFGDSTHAEFLLDRGPLAPTIVSNAARLHCDLIVMALRPGYGIATNFRTTTAYGVVLTAPCPVLTVRAGS